MIENLLAYTSFRSITESFSSIEYSILGFETSFTLNIMIIQVARSSQQCKNTHPFRLKLQKHEKSFHYFKDLDNSSSNKYVKHFPKILFTHENARKYCVK